MVGADMYCLSSNSEETSVFIEETEKVNEEEVSSKKNQRLLFTQYQNCKQGFRTVEDYTLEFHKMASINDLNESEEQMIARYVE